MGKVLYQKNPLVLFVGFLGCSEILILKNISDIIRKGEVKEGYIEDVDMTIVIHSKYLGPLNNKNFCSIIRESQKNGDFGYESKISDAKLLWKYKGMVKYRECFEF